MLSLPWGTRILDFLNPIPYPAGPMEKTPPYDDSRKSLCGGAKARKTWIPENWWRIREKKNRLDKKRNRKVF